MAKFARIERSSSFDRTFKKKSPEGKAAIARAIRRVAEGDESHGLRIKKMRGHENVWEARADRSRRLTFEVNGDTLYLRANCDHDILKNP